jgi:hypothetical protein
MNASPNPATKDNRQGGQQDYKQQQQQQQKKPIKNRK